MADVLIHRGEAFEPDWRIERKEPLTGTPEPISVDSAVRWWLSLTYKGDAITPAIVTTLARRELELREDDRVFWFEIVDADTVTDALTGIATGTKIYEVCEVDGERKSSPVVVAD